MIFDKLKVADWINAQRLGVYPRIFLVMYVLIGLAWPFGLYGEIKTDAGVIYTDFINVYAAGVAAHQGASPAIYDEDSHRDAEYRIITDHEKDRSITADDGYIPWLYPPVFLTIAWLVALLPYFTALIFYEAVGALIYLAVLRKLAPVHYPQTKWIIAAFPGTFVNLWSGQNGFITAALLGMGLALLDQSPVAAGIFLGGLSYKPHFFILIPLALLIGRYWKALIASLLSASLWCGLSLAAFGPQVWQEFFARVPGMSKMYLEYNGQGALTRTLHSVFSMIRIWGGDLQTAYIVQAVVGGLAVVGLLWIWRHKETSLAVRGSALVAASFLVSPYSFVYDQVLLALPIALLVRQGLQRGFLPYEKFFLAALWLLPFFVKDGTPHFHLTLTPPMLTCLMILCWQRMKMEQKQGLIAERFDKNL